MADHPADSTDQTVRLSDQAILDSIEKLFDKKFGKLESKLCIIEQKQDNFQREQDKIIEKIVKVKNSVDDLNDLTDKETRKIKDEVYNIQDNLDGISENIKDIKSDTRENLENIESTLDKTVKIHKHLKVQEVSNLIKTENNTDSNLDEAKILDEIVPELKSIKNLLKSPKKADNVLDFDDINLSITTLTNDIQEINKKIAQNEENTKLFHSFKEALDSNSEKLNSEVKNQIGELKNSNMNSVSISELCEKMNYFEDCLLKKTVEIKKCVIEESTENLKILQDTKNETKMSLLNTTNEILKNVTLKKDAITKDDLKKIEKKSKDSESIDLFTKIEVLKDDFKSLLEDFIKKSATKSNSNDPKFDEKKFLSLKIDLEKSLTKVHLDSFKEMTKIVKNLNNSNFESILKEFETNMDKNFTELKSSKKDSSIEFKNSILESIEEIRQTSEDSSKTSNENHEKICEKLDTLTSLEPSIILELKDLRSEIENNSHKKNFKSVQKLLKEISSVQENSRENFDEKFQKLRENMDKQLNFSEILNSVEDLKQLLSSIPSTIYELNPKIEKIESIMQSTSDDLTTKLRVLEGSVIDKNTKTHQESLEHIIKKFDMVENRFAVIRKYVKNQLQLNNQTLEPPTGSGNQSPAGSMFSIRSPAPSVAGSESEKNSSGSAQDLKLHMNAQCKILGDSIAAALDKFLPMVDTTKVRKSIEEINKTLSTFSEIKDMLIEISKDQAKASVVEDQLQALATTILEPVEELKPIQDQLLSTIEEEIRALTNTNSNDALDTLNMNQSLILKELKKSKKVETDPESWIDSLVESLRKVQNAQIELINKAELQQTLTNSLTEVLPLIQNDSENLKQKIELFTQLEDNHQSVHDGREEIRNLIKDVKDILDAQNASEIDTKTQRRKKSRGKKRSSSASIRRSRKSAKVSYTENENSDDENE